MHLALGDCALVPLAKAFQRLFRRELCLLKMAGDTAAGAYLGLMLGQALGKVQVTQLIGFGFRQ